MLTTANKKKEATRLLFFLSVRGAKLHNSFCFFCLSVWGCFLLFFFPISHLVGLKQQDEEAVSEGSRQRQGRVCVSLLFSSSQVSSFSALALRLFRRRIRRLWSVFCAASEPSALSRPHAPRSICHHAVRGRPCRVLAARRGLQAGEQEQKRKKRGRGKEDEEQESFFFFFLNICLGV